MKITRLALSIDAPDLRGYRLTASLYQDGDLRPSSVEEYPTLCKEELEDLVLALIECGRPGLDRFEAYLQPSLLAWVLDTDGLDGHGETLGES